MGSSRSQQLYEEVTIPAPKAVPFRFDEKLRLISEMDPWGRRTFHVSGSGWLELRKQRAHLLIAGLQNPQSPAIYRLPRRLHIK